MEELKSDNISELGLPRHVESNLECKDIKTISEIVNQSKNGRLYEMIWYKETLKIINYKLQKYGLKLWNYDDEEVLSQDEICYLYCQYDGSDNPLNYYGINNIELLTSLTKVELEKLLKLPKSEVKRIIETVHSYDLKFADEREETISIERKPFISLGFSKRAIHILMDGNIYSVSELIAKTKNELKKLEGMGAVSLNEIIQKVHSLGLKFADEREEENTIVQNDIVEPINDTPSISEQMNQSKLDKLARIQELQKQIIALQQEQSILMQELNEELSKGDIHARQSK